MLLSYSEALVSLKVPLGRLLRLVTFLSHFGVDESVSKWTFLRFAGSSGSGVGLLAGTLDLGLAGAGFFAASLDLAATLAFGAAFAFGFAGASAFLRGAILDSM